jgi:hypothetical protein
MAINLKSILVPSKITTVEYPGMPGFDVDLAFLSRESLQGLRKKATKNSYKGRQLHEEVNDDLFLELYVDATVKGWKGFTVGHLKQLAPIETAGLQDTDVVEFSKENALDLMKSSSQFDSWVAEIISDLGNFSKTK